MTDMQMLRALIASRRLAGNEEAAFKGMLGCLERGEQIALSRNQRIWAEERFEDLDLKNKPLPANVPPPKPSNPIEGMPWAQNLPKKPPGRK